MSWCTFYLDLINLRNTLQPFRKTDERMYHEEIQIQSQPEEMVGLWVCMSRSGLLFCFCFFPPQIPLKHTSHFRQRVTQAVRKSSVFSVSVKNNYTQMDSVIVVEIKPHDPGGRPSQDSWRKHQMCSSHCFPRRKHANNFSRKTMGQLLFRHKRTAIMTAGPLAKWRRSMCSM